MQDKEALMEKLNAILGEMDDVDRMHTLGVIEGLALARRINDDQGNDEGRRDKAV